jgi:hypothetical protein
MEWWRTPRSKPAPTPEHIPAAISMMAAEREDAPLGGWAGEMAVHNPAASAIPPPAPPTSFYIPPPNWSEELRERREREAEEINPVEFPQDAPHGSAVGTMMNEARERGEIEEPPSPLGSPPMTYPPMQRFVPPEPDWQTELAERELQEAKERARRERYDKLVRLIDEEGT